MGSIWWGGRASLHTDLSSLQPIHVGFTNCFPIDTGEGLVLIDTGINSDQCWHQLTAGLEALGRRLEEVRWVLLTHAHIDHCGLAHRVKAATGAQVLIHEKEVFHLEEGRSQGVVNREHFRRLFVEHGAPPELIDWYFEKLRPGWVHNWRERPTLFDKENDFRLRTELMEEHVAQAPSPAGPLEAQHATPPVRQPDGWQRPGMTPDSTFRDGDTVELGNLRLVAYHTPGHTPGHACFHHEESGVLFTGDHILRRITPNPSLYFLENRYEQRTRSLPDFIRSLEKLRRLEARRVLGAHEGEMSDLTAAVDRLVAHHERRAVTALHTVERGRNTAFTVLPILFPNLRATALLPAFSETIGHLDLLEERGDLRPGWDANVIRYAATRPAHPEPVEG